MKKEQEYPAWFLWIWQHGFRLLSGLAILVMAVVTFLAFHMDQRLENIEDQLAERPPQSYQPPDLQAFAPVDTPPEAFAVERTVYVPIYSHVYYDGGRAHLLEATLSIRNIDARRPVYVRSVKYYNTNGGLVRTHVDRCIQLDPLETIEFLVEKHETAGGSGANFIVEWAADESVEEPMIEAVMVGMFGARAFAFARGGRTLAAPLQPPGVE